MANTTNLNKKEAQFVQEMRRRCFYLYDETDFKQNLLMPVKEHIPHDAAGITDVIRMEEKFNPQGVIYYGYPQEYLLTYGNREFDSVPVWEKHFQGWQEKGLTTARDQEIDSFSETAEYRLFYQPHGFKHGMQTFFFEKDGMLAGVYGMNKRIEPCFTDKEKSLLEELAPPLFFAFRKHQWFKNLNFFHTSSMDALLFCIIVSDLSGKIIYLNGAASAVLEKAHRKIPSHLPEELKSLSEKIKNFSSEIGSNPLIFREIKFFTPYGTGSAALFDKSVCNYLNAKDTGIVFGIDTLYDKDIKLTVRELEILRCLSKGMFSKDIAVSLSIAEKTVDAHMSNIFKKLEVYNRTEAVHKAIKLKLI